MKDKHAKRITSGRISSEKMVKKRTLLLIAGIVWLIAGFNVVRLGIVSYFIIEQRWYWYL